MNVFSRCFTRLASSAAWCRLAMLLFLPALSAKAADEPVWWTTQVVTEPNAPYDDYAAANAGQLKNLAAKAADEMEKRLATVGGAGSAILGMVQAWKSQTPQALAMRDDYAAVTLGQVKNIVSKFHDRIAYVKLQPTVCIRGAGRRRRMITALPMSAS